MIFDPEEVGFMLRNIVNDNIKYPCENTGDFQDILIWKELTVEVAKRLKNTYKKDLIIPMTICTWEYLDYILKELYTIDDRIYKFCLIAEKETIEKRFLKRGDKNGSWALWQIDRCLEALEKNKEFFDYTVDTEGVSVVKSAEHI